MRGGIGLGSVSQVTYCVFPTYLSWYCICYFHLMIKWLAQMPSIMVWLLRQHPMHDGQLRRHRDLVAHNQAFSLYEVVWRHGSHFSGRYPDGTAVLQSGVCAVIHVGSLPKSSHSIPIYRTPFRHRQIWVPQPDRRCSLHGSLHLLGVDEQVWPDKPTPAFQYP